MLHHTDLTQIKGHDSSVDMVVSSIFGNVQVVWNSGGCSFPWSGEELKITSSVELDKRTYAPDSYARLVWFAMETKGEPTTRCVTAV
ncbi:hypothetical protein NPIL_388881 [Nephila pilipes]|uniref:Uncharacterized protein n=1 Tax=Nephila pilipes TaxID=299642 RepID=A0A8X6MTX0_NEPPI|nr:hypothetical protein NPIL_388881 [Nephila pilipes]